MRRLLPEELDRVGGGYDPADPYATFDPVGGDGGIGGDDGGIGGDDGGGGDPGGGGGDPDPITTDALVDEILDLIDQEIAGGTNYLDPAWTAADDDGGGQVGHDQNSYYYETLGQQIMSNFDMQFQAFQQEAGDHFAHQQAVAAFQSSLNQAIANGDDIAPYLIQLGYNLPPGTVTAAHTAGGQTVYTFTAGEGDVSPVIVVANCDANGSISSIVFTSGLGFNIASGALDKGLQAKGILDVIEGAIELVKNANATNTALVDGELISEWSDGTWKYAITDEDGEFAGWVSITSTGWYFEDAGDNMTFNKQYATKWSTLAGVIYQEQLAFQDRAWGANLAPIIENMFFGRLFGGTGLPSIVVNILTELGFNATGWAAGNGNPTLFARAQEVAYEMRKLKLQGYNPPN